jgi:pimeloyl-ACP methyl ester carboxylesterase
MFWSKLFRLPFALLALSQQRRPSDATREFQKLYDDLGRGAASDRYVQATPTLRFMHVSAPTSTAGQKPLAFYLPGLDGYGISAATNQFDDLSRAFDLWRLFIEPTDRSSFLQVTQTICGFLDELQANHTNTHITLIGESMGGLLAAAVVLQTNARLDGLVLVNPATSFDQTAWDQLVPILTSLKYIDMNTDAPTPYSVFGSLILSTVVPDGDQMRRIVEALVNSLGMTFPPSLEQLQDIINLTASAFSDTEARLPPELLEHRIQWLSIGAPIVNSRLSQINSPTLVLVGQQDKLLPSAQEANRIVSMMPNAKKLVVRNRGHFVLDENVNLTEAIMYSDIDPWKRKERRKKFDVITDWKLPPRDVIDQVAEQTVTPLRNAHSPIFFSTDSNGKRWKGLGKIPDGQGPLLIVGNHQFGKDECALEYALPRGEMMDACGLTHCPLSWYQSSQLHSISDLFWLNYSSNEACGHAAWRIR